MAEKMSGSLAVLYRIACLALLGSLVGSIVSLCALAFVDCVLWLNDLLLIAPHSRIQHEETPGLVAAATLLVPTLGGLVVGLILYRLMDEKRPLGPPDTILAVQTRTPPPSLRSGLLSTLAAVLSLGAGASVGQYGPMVYLGTLIGSLATKLKLSFPNLQAIAIASGVAAAIATAFNAPIAGLVFAHEVILRHYSIQAFAPTTVAAASGYIVANVIFERPPLFLVAFEGVQYGHEFLLFALIGVLGALLALFYMKAILFSADLAKRSPIPLVFRPMVAGLLLGLVALALPDVLGIGQTTLRFATIEGAFTAPEILVILLAKIFVTALCLGFGFAGGVFSPALLIGILFGALFGSVVADYTGLEHSGLVPYAICGMMAVTSPVIGAPLATILIVFELTRSYDLTIAAMVAVVFANLVGYRLFGRSLFDVQLSRRGFDLSLGRDSAILAQIPITEFMQRDFLQFTPDETVEHALERFSESRRAEGLVVGENGSYRGVLRAQDCISHEADTAVDHLADRKALTFDESTTVWQAMEQLRNFLGEITPVVSSEDGRLLGAVPESRVIEAYLKTVDRLRREENEAV